MLTKMQFPIHMVPWVRGQPLVCKTSYTGSNPVGTSRECLDYQKEVYVMVNLYSLTGEVGEWLKPPSC
jgi:hypothetical protein